MTCRHSMPPIRRPASSSSSRCAPSRGGRARSSSATRTGISCCSRGTTKATLDGPDTASYIQGVYKHFVYIRMATDDFLPLKPDAFYVLLVLVSGERHGYAIMRDASEQSGRRVELQAGALYR